MILYIAWHLQKWSTGFIFYLWLSKISANDRRHYMKSFPLHWQRPCSVWEVCIYFCFYLTIWLARISNVQYIFGESSFSLIFVILSNQHKVWQRPAAHFPEQNLQIQTWWKSGFSFHPYFKEVIVTALAYFMTEVLLWYMHKLCSVWWTRTETEQVIICKGIELLFNNV